jgi:hypothetical protein
MKTRSPGEQLVGICLPDWQAIFADDEESNPCDQCQAFLVGRDAGRQDALAVLLRILSWMDDEGKSRGEALRDRAAAVQYLLNPNYASYDQKRDLVSRYGYHHRQQLNRSIQQFRDAFKFADTRLFSATGRKGLRQAHQKSHGE